jgi:hypothetical protein
MYRYKTDNKLKLRGFKRRSDEYAEVTLLVSLAQSRLDTDWQGENMEQPKNPEQFYSEWAPKRKRERTK